MTARVECEMPHVIRRVLTRTLMSTSSPKKRSRDSDASDVPPAKVAKTTSSALRWLDSLGATCLYAEHLDPKFTSKVAALDLDGTLISSPHKGPPLEWRWWKDCVPAKLAQAVREGYVPGRTSMLCGL